MIRSIKKWICSFLSICILLTHSPVAAAETLEEAPEDSEHLVQERVIHPDVQVPGKNATKTVFTDIHGHSNKKAIEMLAERGIVSGVSANRYAPDGLLTRAEFAAILVRALGLPVTGHTLTFSDVPASSRYAPYIAAAGAYGIMNGKTETAFRPNLYVTREEASIALMNAGELCAMDVELTQEKVNEIIAPFYDTQQAEQWAHSGLAFCFNENIFTVKTLYINPKKQMTRGQAAEVVYALLVRAGLL